MSKLTDTIAELEDSAPLEPSKEERIHYLQSAGIYTSQFIDSLPFRNTFSNTKANADKLS